MTYTEIKANLYDVNRSWHALQERNDGRLKEIARAGASDPLTDAGLSRLNAEISEKTERRLAMLEAALARPDAGDIRPSALPGEREHRKAFLDYLRKGADSGLEALERKALSVGSNADGGYLVSPHLSEMIVRTVQEGSPMRKLAGIETISTDSLDVIDDRAALGGGWTTETGAVSDSTTPTIGKRNVPTHEMYAQPKATQKLLDDASIDVEKWLAEKIAARFASLEGTAFVSGDGSGKPKGILAYAAGTAWEQIEQVNSGTSASVTADGLLTLFYRLKEAHAGRASFLMHRSAVEQARLLKDSEGQYLWAPGLSVGRPDSLLGAPVYMASDMPVPAADSLSVAVGDFGAAYRIVDRTGVRVLRDPFTDKPFVKFYATKRVGGDVVNFEAVKLLKLAA
jgi:HK97 family phage major capsid protein